MCRNTNVCVSTYLKRHRSLSFSAKDYVIQLFFFTTVFCVTLEFFKNLMEFLERIIEKNKFNEISMAFFLKGKAIMS